MITLTIIAILLILLIAVIWFEGLAVREQDHVLASEARIKEIEQQTIRALVDAAREHGVFQDRIG
jgi:hypothetical protein